MTTQAEAIARLIAVLGDRPDKTQPVTFIGEEWEAFMAVVAPETPAPEPTPAPTPEPAPAPAPEPAPAPPAPA